MNTDLFKKISQFSEYYEYDDFYKAANYMYEKKNKLRHIIATYKYYDLKYIFYVISNSGSYSNGGQATIETIFTIKKVDPEHCTKITGVRFKKITPESIKLSYELLTL